MPAKPSAATVKPSAATRKAAGGTTLSPADRDIFDLRMARSADDLWAMTDRLYGAHPDYPVFRDRLTAAMVAAWVARPADLKRQDLARDLEPDWFQRPGMAGYVFYIDRFAGNLRGILDRLDYLNDLGITYVHLMPCLKPRPGDSDGGYSVMDYRAINPAYGTMEDFQEVAAALRARGMSLCVDLVLNHTAKEHDWAVQARNGSAAHQDMYLMFDDDRLPKEYERTLVEVFPNDAPGNFTFYPDIGPSGKWVWTTFNEHQWDLNWANPQVFLEIAGVMLFLANKGVDVLRLDAVAFMWKRMGTRCQSEPEVHMILRALRAVCRVACASVLHLEEAIVGPAEMLTYFGRGEHDGREGNLCYHNSLMVQFWSALATRDTELMRHVLGTHFPAQLTNATYATYIRCHDDIGWAVTDEDAAALGFSGPAHRAFLSDFYYGSFPGTFARGALFQENPATGDKRISGTFASLAGLEAAEAAGDAGAVDLAVERILMGHALIAGFGGIPLIYMGDEVALPNDWAYRDEPAHAHDSRWLHRPRMDWARADAARSAGGGGESGTSGRVYRGVRQILARRRVLAGLHGAVPVRVADAGDPGVLAVLRDAPTGPIVQLYNFTGDWRPVTADRVLALGARAFRDELAGADVEFRDGAVVLPPYGRMWMV